MYLSRKARTPRLEPLCRQYVSLILVRVDVIADVVERGRYAIGHLLAKVCLSLRTECRRGHAHPWWVRASGLRKQLSTPEFAVSGNGAPTSSNCCGQPRVGLSGHHQRRSPVGESTIVLPLAPAPTTIHGSRKLLWGL